MSHWSSADLYRVYASLILCLVRKVSMTVFFSISMLSQFHLLVVLPLVSRHDSWALKSAPIMNRGYFGNSSLRALFFRTARGLSIHRNQQSGGNPRKVLRYSAQGSWDCGLKLVAERRQSSGDYYTCPFFTRLADGGGNPQTYPCA